MKSLEKFMENKHVPLQKNELQFCFGGGNSSSTSSSRNWSIIENGVTTCYTTTTTDTYDNCGELLETCTSYSSEIC